MTGIYQFDGSSEWSGTISGPVALKEWASAIRALERGEQTFILRKGGIAEETKQFRMESGRFVLYPSYEHQKAELLKDRYRHYVPQTIDEWKAERRIPIVTSYADAVQEWLLHTDDELARIRDLHIWTDAFAEERLHWKRKQPLHLIALRVYKLAAPVPVPLIEAYGGCKSWISLQAKIDLSEARPVLDEETLQTAIGRIRSALEN